jgi:flagellar biosynthesis chaperone FliJ
MKHFSFTLQLFADHMVEPHLTLLQIWQEGLLEEEIQKLQDEIKILTNYIESQKSEVTKLEAALVRSHNDYNDMRKKRDELQEERKYEILYKS